MHRTRYQRILITGLCLFCILTGLCIAAELPKEVSHEVTNPDVNAVEPTDPSLAWTKVPMTDAVTGEQFSIDDLAKLGKP
ncbi:MAG: hypothetical protein V1862_00515, partial [Methanobacteriota archaeon]